MGAPSTVIDRSHSHSRFRLSAGDCDAEFQFIFDQAQADGSLEPQPLETPSTPEFWSGGGPLYSTGPDYLTFLQMLLHGGSFNGAQLLRPETVALMGEDYWSYGIDGNQPTLEAILRYHHKQGLSSRQLAISELFAPATLEQVRV